ncbi:MAG: DUF721 domain-containing protein [Actinomycetota bacterium]
MSPRSKGWRDPDDGARSAEVTSVSDIVRGLLGQRPFKRGVAVGTLTSSWTEVVGERLAAETKPARLDAGTLVVEATSGPWGSQATFLAEEIRKRANEVLGTESVQHVRVAVAPARRDGPKPL